jgi:hypothetical protein
LWATLKEERGIDGRDAIWHHPDLLPTAEDLDDPKGFSARRKLAEASDSEVDDALQKLLSGGFDSAPEAEDGDGDGGQDSAADIAKDDGGRPDEGKDDEGGQEGQPKG